MKRIGALAVLLSLLCLPLLNLHASVSPISIGDKSIGLSGAEAASSGGENLVYQSVNDAGEVQYVGITNDLARRAAEHLASKGISIDAIPGLSNLARADARAVEQTLIENFDLAKNGGTLINKINSIAQTNPIYAQALQRGAALLHQIGYPGF